MAGFRKSAGKFFSDLVEGAMKGTDAKSIRNVNRLKSNMTDAQKTVLRNKNIKNVKLNNSTSKTAMRQSTSMASQIGDAVGGGIRETVKGAKAGGVGSAIEGFKRAHTNADGSVNWGRAAGTFAAVNVAGRVVTGGGLYKDRNGNTNIPGIPFL